MKYGEIKKLKLSEKRIFKVAVVSTMSSGKSTLINAMVGRELLPSINQACTSRLLSVLDNDSREEPRGHILYADQTYERVDNCTIDVVRSFNDNVGKPISDIIVECNIAGIHNAKTALLLVDTPGVNNNLDVEHRTVTWSFLQEMEEGLILYVINAAQLSTHDNIEFLRELRELLKQKNQIGILFVVNKVDEIDPEREDLFDMIRTAADYLKEIGFERPKIIPVSAEAGLLIKMTMSGRELTESEQDMFAAQYRKFSKRVEPCRDCRELVWDDDVQSGPTVEIDGRTYLPARLHSALEQTGIPTLEREIEGSMLQATGAKAPLVRKIKRERKKRK